jgi:hypothetical protein
LQVDLFSPPGKGYFAKQRAIKDAYSKSYRDVSTLDAAFADELCEALVLRFEADRDD